MTDDERAIRELVARWMAASRASDTATVLGLMSDDVLFMTPGREPFGKAEFAAQSASLNDIEMDGRADVLEIEVAGDWAWIRNRIEVAMIPAGGETMHRSGYTLTVLNKGGDGRWRLFRDANLVT
ncbi:MAG TPA: SgcJ/EcaC family oxidoreductase [Sphingomicrobium sp.]|jgi:uncharacterized protein (TIGR02246 family)|nr:SgcJ/EcaC family oxidoreductase [Sphingomicrobium sp.]